MKKLPILFSLLVAAITAITMESCKKDEPNQVPVLRLDTPADSSNWTFNDTLRITGNLSDDYGLHTCAIAITKNSDGDTVFTAFPDVHDETSYDLNLKFVPQFAGTYNLSIVIVDHDSARAETARVFFVVP